MDNLILRKEDFQNDDTVSQLRYSRVFAFCFKMMSLSEVPTQEIM